MKINRKIAIGSVSAAAVAGLGISAGIALAAPAAATSAASADGGLASTAQAHATVKPKQPAPRKADQWITVRREAARDEAARDEAARDEATRDRTQAAAAAQATQPAVQGQSQPLTAGMSAFEQCVAWRESSDNPTASSAGLFGILPATWQSLGYSGTAGTSSVALQKVAFDRLYAQYGTSPWAPYDGC